MQRKYVRTVVKLRRPMLDSLLASPGTVRQGVVPEGIDTTAVDGPDAADLDDSHGNAYLDVCKLRRSAARSLVHCHKLSPFSSNLEASMVYATSSTPIIRQRDFKRGFLQLLFSDLEKEIDRALSSLKFRYNGSLHAEAIGMVLACSVHKVRPVEAELPQQQSYLKPVSEVSTTPIGVRKKCCFCCDPLASLLTSFHDGKRSLSYSLQGTHSTVFPCP
ncbi:hypothetical protein BD311DRAFT_430077 [Dichomitus squalens]|uniref:Uncharacterized protein n=1 Tax=Dichomitus squalens TaxID=114155 RepID=A0A4Q9MIS9_9APHY|nr:hypothetical protein BD311DRAFT_430077 [Dichomitus squalens]